jgi:multisubunit Na+/H+ antiporter MnhG subunit
MTATKPGHEGFMMHTIKEYWGFAMLPAALIAWLGDIMHWTNSLLTMLVILITVILAYYRMSKAKINRDIKQIELDEVRKHQTNEKWMRHWMDNRQKDVSDSD